MQTAPANRVIRWLITGFIVFLFCTRGRLASAQTESELEGRFKEVATFEIRPWTIVFPTIEANGAECRMVVEKRNYVDPNLHTDRVIPEMAADELVAELIPAEERGRKSKFRSPTSYLAGEAYSFKQDYENISVTMYGAAVSGLTENGTRAVIIDWPKGDCSPLKAGSRFERVATLEIRPGINVFPTFAGNGSVCRMIVEKRVSVDPNNVGHNNVIPVALAHQLVDELVPANERGTPSKYLNPESFFTSGTYFAKQDYENVSVMMYGSEIVGQENGTMAIVIEWPKRDCPPVKAETKSE